MEWSIFSSHEYNKPIKKFEWKSAAGIALYFVSGIMQKKQQQWRGGEILPLECIF